MRHWLSKEKMSDAALEFSLRMLGIVSVPLLFAGFLVYMVVDRRATLWKVAKFLAAGILGVLAIIIISVSCVLLTGAAW